MIKIIFLLTFLVFSNASANNFGYKNCNHHKFTFMMIKAYDVYLCVDNKEFLQPEKIFTTNFSLVINYDMNFSKKELSDSSIEEINRYYKISKNDQKIYHKKLMSIFPEVKKGDVIEAKYNKKGEISFFHNEKFSGKIDEAKFSKLFLNIWLYKDNKYQKMTKDLFND
jgi:hypothetical protein